MRMGGNDFGLEVSRSGGFRDLDRVPCFPSFFWSAGSKEGDIRQCGYGWY